MDINLTIGQYIKGDSWIYRLDPRLKIISVIVLMITLFLMPTFIHIIVAIALLFLIILSAKLPIKSIINGLKPILFISLFSFVIQIVYSNTGTLIYSLDFNISLITIITSISLIALFILTSKFIPFKFIYLLLILVAIISCFIFIDYKNIYIYQFNIFSDGIINGGFFVTRIIAVVMLSSLLTITTSTIDLNTGLERVLKPFKFIIPVSEIALMISLTLRFVPTLLLETNKILKAQASRGVDFAEGNIMQKVKQIVTLLIPMFVVSFKRADDLASAMESRGYIIGQQRTNLNVLKFTLIDYIGFVVVFSALSYGIILQVMV